jgi:alpha-glucosidase
MSATKPEKYCWWKHGVIYHIYPRSFKDSNGDGIGDLRGIIEKIDYLSELGIEGIWLSPVYDSPNYDFGYDVRDYYQLNPEYGTMEDLRELLDVCHQKGIKLIMDMILNHTSIEHQWFKESSSSREHPKRDWYIWHMGKNGRRPNNWKSLFAGSAWQWHEDSGEYYLHSFLKEQADLNWRDPELQKEFFKILEFWLNFGIDGFRFDVINLIAKDKKFRSNPGIFEFFRKKGIYTRNRPASYKIVREIRKILDAYPGSMSVGEIYTLPPGNPKLAASYLGKNNEGLHLTFNFALFFRFWNSRAYYKAIKKWIGCVEKRNGWPCFVFSNHDLLRSINRLGTGTDKEQKARVLAVLLLTIKGTPFIYYGEEIGMPNTRFEKDEILDPLGKKLWPFFMGRDGARTPMRWNNTKYGGFSKVFPWLPVGEDLERINLETQANIPGSIFHIYKRIIQIRKEYDSLSMGAWKPLIKGKNGIIAYFRLYRDQKLLVLLNFTGKERTIDLGIQEIKRVIFSTLPGLDNFTGGFIKLQAFQCAIIEMNKERSG